MRNQRLTVILLGFLATACAPGVETRPMAQSPDDREANPEVDPTGETQTTQGSSGGTTTPFDGEDFFLSTLKPALKLHCETCHAAPRFNPPQPGPLTIFNYETMLAKLKAGKGSGDNDLINKVRGRLTHGGGDRCPQGNSQSPCNLLVQWWQGENGDDSGTGSSANAYGRMSAVSPTGSLYGYAANPADTAATVTVRIYKIEASGAKTLIMEAQADQSGDDNNTPGMHAYGIQLPAAYRNQVQHTIKGYAVIGGEEIELGGSPQTFTAYMPDLKVPGRTDTGEDYFDANVRAFHQSNCGSCHVTSYTTLWSALLRPSPAEGGTAATNLLVSKGGGNGHGGGNRCGTCDVFRNWWNKEFAANAP